MKVEIYYESKATKPHPAGGEQYAPEIESTWSLQDSILSDDPEIIAAFLGGLAEELDPGITHNAGNRVTTGISVNWKVIIYATPRGDNPGLVLAEIISKRAKVIASMLRGTASSITQQQVTIKKPAMRGYE